MKKFIILVLFFIILTVAKSLFLIFGMGSFVVLCDILLSGLFILLVTKLYSVLRIVNIDDLTGSYNRKHFFDMLRKETEKAKRQQNNLSLCMFDLDDFKSINDRYGHFLGDATLKEFSEIVQNNIREYDLFARLGGEEFALLITDADEDYVYEVCERIRNEVKDNTFDGSVCMTISVGIAAWKEGDNIDTLYEKADKAMYESKIHGKNITTMWDNGIVKINGSVKTCRED